LTGNLVKEKANIKNNILAYLIALFYMEQAYGRVCLTNSFHYSKYIATRKKTN
jgi:hypothetical protein